MTHPDEGIARRFASSNLSACCLLVATRHDKKGKEVGQEQESVGIARCAGLWRPCRGRKRPAPTKGHKSGQATRGGHLSRFRANLRPSPFADYSQAKRARCAARQREGAKQPLPYRQPCAQSAGRTATGGLLDIASCAEGPDASLRSLSGVCVHVAGFAVTAPTATSPC